ncbi:MAG: hypothetical protein ACKVY0_16220 [Prosthecobacter sp.]|uniref:hypothetical protein n=1 Tax=Prosthecobacter sp. TaxID=1965333 RepID=UPI003902C534
MKPTTDTQTLLPDAADLAQAMLQAAAKLGGDPLAPETSTGTAAITAWDEPPDAAGYRMLQSPAVGEATIAEQLVDAGNAEADLEQRHAQELLLAE